MNTRQGIAYSSPCYEAEATTQRKFGSVGRADRWPVTVVLTVNVGLE